MGLLTDLGVGFDAEGSILRTCRRSTDLNVGLQYVFMYVNHMYSVVLRSLTLLSVGYTILSVKQEKILDELDNEAKVQIWKGPRTGANS